VEAASVEWQSTRIQSTNGETMENWFVSIGVKGVNMNNGGNEVANIESGMSHVRKKWVIYKNQERIHQWMSNTFLFSLFNWIMWLWPLEILEIVDRRTLSMSKVYPEARSILAYEEGEWTGVIQEHTFYDWAGCRWAVQDIQEWLGEGVLFLYSLHHHSQKDIGLDGFIKINFASNSIWSLVERMDIAIEWKLGRMGNSDMMHIRWLVLDMWVIMGIQTLHRDEL